MKSVRELASGGVNVKQIADLFTVELLGPLMKDHTERHRPSFKTTFSKTFSFTVPDK